MASSKKSKFIFEDGLPERMIFEALPEPSIKELLFDTGNCYSNKFILLFPAAVRPYLFLGLDNPLLHKKK